MFTQDYMRVTPNRYRNVWVQDVVTRKPYYVHGIDTHPLRLTVSLYYRGRVGVEKMWNVANKELIWDIPYPPGYRTSPYMGDFWASQGGERQYKVGFNRYSLVVRQNDRYDMGIACQGHVLTGEFVTRTLPELQQQIDNGMRCVAAAPAYGLCRIAGANVYVLWYHSYRAVGYLHDGQMLIDLDVKKRLKFPRQWEVKYEKAGRISELLRNALQAN